MSSKYPVLRSLDPYQQRLGYLNCVALVAGRDLDRRDALAARFQDLIFERIYKDDPRWSLWFERATPAGRESIRQAMATAALNDPAAILLKNQQEDGWVHAQDLWINDADMPSNVGGISFEAVASDEAKLYRAVELAKWIELILPTYELSENGVIVRAMLEQRRAQIRECFNPLLVGGFYPLQLMYLRMLLSSECLFPVLIAELVRNSDARTLFTSGDRGLLLVAVRQLLEVVGEPRDPSDILELQGLLEFQDSLIKSDSTAENYLRPRLEILVDLGLVKRQSRQDGFVWSANDITRRCAEAWRPLAEQRMAVDIYLDREFFGSMAGVIGRQHEKMSDPKEILREFAAAFTLVGREFGFTPGRTVATVACIRAWMANRALEIETVFDTIYSLANSDLGKHLHFSGGSRFDREFLIRVSPELTKALGT